MSKFATRLSTVHVVSADLLIMSPLFLRVCVLVSLQVTKPLPSLFHRANKLTQSCSRVPLLPFFMFVYVRAIAQDYDVRNSKANRWSRGCWLSRSRAEELIGACRVITSAAHFTVWLSSKHTLEVREATAMPPVGAGKVVRM